MGSKSAIGIGNGICFKQVRDKGGGSYIDPLVRDSIVGLWKFDQNTNESPTRNIIKNTIKDKGGDLELLNFAYKLNSGYNGYIEDFSLFTLSNRFEYSEISDTKITITAVLNNITGIYHSVKEEDSALYWNTFKIKVSGSTDDVYISYITAKKNIRLYNGINTVVVPNELSWHSFSASKANTSCNITLEFVPLYEGALVTDGKDDMIVSQKTVQEMGITNEITVVSMIHQINAHNSAANASYTNYIKGNIGFVRNTVTNADKTGIYGYTWNNSTKSTINNILGDKNDYRIETGNSVSLEEKFSVEGYINNGSPTECSEVAIYWTFISNKVLTTDEINQIIGYFKLDKYVTPQVIYDVRRQGLTNDTPTADWYLKDFSGNGHDMQLYNYAKSKDSGIGKYELDFNEFNFAVSNPENTLFIKTSSYLSLTKRGDVETASRVYTVKGAGSTQYPSYKVRIEGLQNGDLVRYWYVDENSKIVSKQISENGEHTIPKSYQSSSDSNLYYSFDIISINIGTITVTQIPDYEGALVSDGKDDYGHADNLPIFKDYTVAIDRAWINLVGARTECLSTKNSDPDLGAFNFELSESISRNTFSFGGRNQVSIDVNRKISYQSKYSYNGVTIAVGNVVDGKDLFLFRSRSAYPYYAEAAIWSYILFPYSLSEFLLERQLKRYKLGTLYPDMIEWRPIAKSNIPYKQIDYFIKRSGAYVRLNPGDYFQSTEDIIVRVTPIRDWQLDVVSSIKVNGKNEVISVNSSYAQTAPIHIDKSPQKIDITIDEYIRYEDIVQPYPAIINLKQDGKTITWGDKLKVGSDIVFVGSANLLPELYTVSETRYNGVTLYPNTIIKVEKSMVFDNARTYLKANEPSCILSPNRLRIPNSSYKILGYIPDLTGKGNHGRLNNFAYAGMSGANGYVEDFTKWSKNSSLDDIEITYDRIKVNKLTGSTVLYVTSNKFINKIKIVASGIPNGGKLTFTQYPDNAIENNKEFEIGGVTTTGSWGFSIKEGLNLDWSNLVIQQIGEHEGSICFDGTDDHITIPTLAHGGKQVLMKVNLQSYDRYLYDQRNNWSQYLAIVSAGKTIAYEYSNKGGKTYIDGILNEHIIDKDLLNITHNITATNANIGVQYAPNIGTSFARGNFAQMALFDFMLFPEISSEEEIQELNDIVGIEGGYVESPNYYWDAYGKKNTDTDRNLIADQVSKDVANALEVKNVGYNSESGYTDDNGLLLDGVEDHAVNTVIPAVTDFTVIAKREFPESALANNQTFLIKGDAINGNNSVNSLLMECYYGAQNYIISFSYQQIVPLEESKISWITPTSYNGNALTKGSGVDSAGLTIGRYRDLYRKAVFYKAMFYTKTIDQLSINMLKNLFERDELIDITNPIFKKKEL